MGLRDFVTVNCHIVWLNARFDCPLFCGTVSGGKLLIGCFVRVVLVHGAVKNYMLNFLSPAVSMCTARLVVTICTARFNLLAP
jgi:hypothetical protein